MIVARPATNIVALTNIAVVLTSTPIAGPMTKGTATIPPKAATICKFSS